MSFTWPWALLSLLVAPALLGIHLWMQRRRRKFAVRVSTIALIRKAVPHRSRWRRYLPIALFLASLVALGVGSARPHASVDVPRNSTSILLAMDVSRSMCSTDVDPNRLVAAQNAARAFIRAQGGGVRIGLVAFSGIAELVVPPTTDDAKLLDAIDNFTTARGTAIGLAILASIDAIAEINPDVAPTGVQLADPEAAPSTPIHEFEPDSIVVLTDGANSRGVDPVTAAGQAAARHIRVYTIGFGTTKPAPAVCTVDQLGNDSGGGGPFGDPPVGGGGDTGGPPRRLLEIDEPTLQKVADLTGGKYFKAQDADQLHDAFRGLPTEITLQHQQVELSVWFVLGAAILAAAAFALSMLWNRFP